MWEKYLVQGKGDCYLLFVIRAEKFKFEKSSCCFGLKSHTLVSLTYSL